MINQQLERLDSQFRLFPWVLPEHAEFVAGKYGSLLATHPVDAERYVQKYQQKEKEAETAYDAQEEFVKSCSVGENEKPQVFPERVKLDWNPEKIFQERAKKPKEKAKKASK